MQAPLLPTDGMLAVERITPDDDCLAQASAKVSTEHREYWIRRMIDAWHASAQQLVSNEVREAVTAW